MDDNDLHADTMSTDIGDDGDARKKNVMKKLNSSLNVGIKKRAATRGASFFGNMFHSFRSSSRVMIDKNDENSSKYIEQFSADLSDAGENRTKNILSFDDDEKEDEKEDEPNTGNLIIDPPMPKIGKSPDFILMKKRNQRAEAGMSILMEMVNRDANQSAESAHHVPVSDGIDRVTVSEAVSERMAKIRTSKEIEFNYTNNLREIQKALNIRKSGLIMMNANYSKVLVRKIEPIVINEARTIVEHLSSNE